MITLKDMQGRALLTVQEQAEALDLTQSKTGEWCANLVEALEALPHLRKLTLRLRGESFPAALAALKNLPNLVDLGILAPPAGLALSPLAACQSLRSLRILSAYQVDAAPLGALLRLERLTLDGTVKSLKVVGRLTVLLGALEPSAKIAVSPAVQESGQSPADGAFANGLLAVRWTPYPILHSMNAADGTGDKVFAPFSLSEEWEAPSAFPGQFLFDRYSSDGLSIVSSDGLSYPSEYISEAATGNSTPLFMDPYIVWQKGINYVGDPADITFEHTELWASPYDKDPAKLKPAKVADLAQTQIDFSAMGGFGEFASLSAPPGGAAFPCTVNTWRIPDGQHRAITPQIRIDTLAGVTREAVYFAARSWQSYQGETETIYRVELASMPTVP